MSKTIVDNLATEYADEGQGSVVLILHGWWRKLSDFDGITAKLKENHRIIRVDLPGFGGTEAPKDVWDITQYTYFINNFLLKLSIHPSVVVGHSFGGRIILKDQFDAEKVVLISAAGLSTAGWRKQVFMVLAKIGDVVSHVPPFVFVRKKLKQQFYKIVGSDYLDSGHMKEVFKVVVEEDLAVFAKKINKPTLLIWGEEDAVTPLKDGIRLSKLIKNSKLEKIQGSGHFVHIEKSEEVAALIEEFIK